MSKRSLIVQLFVHLLFKCKPLFKAFVWIDYLIRVKRFPPKLELFENRRDIIVVNNRLLGFYSYSFGQYEIISRA